MMNKTQTCVAKVRKKAEPVHQREKESACEQSPVQQVAPQAAYQYAQLNRNGLTPIDLLTLQRKLGNRSVQNILVRRLDRANGQPQSAFAEENSGSRVQQAGAATKQENEGIIRRKVRVETTTQSGLVQLSALSDQLRQLWTTKGKGPFFERVRQLSTSERADSDLQAFTNTLGGDDRWLTQNLLAYGPEAGWPIYLRVEREMKGWSDSGGKGAVFEILRAANGAKATDIQLTKSLNHIFAAGTDDIWLAQNLQSYGREANWPIELRVEREMKGWSDSGGKGAVFEILRAANGAEASNLKLTESINRVFGPGTDDVRLAQNLQAYGPEAQWPIPILTEWREHLMEDLAKVRKPLADQVNTAATDADRRTAMLALRAADAPRLAELRRLAGATPNRWRHPDPAVQDAVLAAIQLEAVFHAEADLSAPSGAHAASAASCGMGMEFNWCGFFAAKNFILSNLDRDLRAGFFHVDNVEDYFTYHYAFGEHARIKKWIYADGAWQELRTYHDSRGSVRRWIDAAAIYAGGRLDIRSGDIVLIDWKESARPDHIVMVHSWDPTTSTLFTIGGNDGGYQVDTRPGHSAPAHESADERAKRERLEAVSGQPLRPGSGGSVGVGAQDLAHQPNPAAVTANPATARPHARVFGIGRPSIVDFEDHFYDSTSAKTAPTTAPRASHNP